MEEMVVEALLFGDRQAQLLAATQLPQFSSKQRHNIAEKGIVPPLVMMLSTNDYEVIEAALFALLSIAFRSERLAVCILHSGACLVSRKSFFKKSI